MIVFIAAMISVKYSSKSELSSRFFGRLKISEDLGQKFSGSIIFSKKMTFWRIYDFLIRVGRCVVKNYCPKCPYFWGDFLVEGVKDSICVFDLDLASKMPSTIKILVSMTHDVLIIWYDDDMIQ